MAKVGGDVERFGWHCLHVYPRVGQEGIGFTYTIGLTATLAHPEIAIFGLDRDRSHRILADCVRDIRNGTRYPLDQPIKDVVGGNVPVIFRTVKPEHLADCFGTAIRYYGRTPFTATVMFWPTREGRWPWEVAGSIQKEGLDVV